MKILTVFSHPFRNNYPGAVMDAFHEPFEQRGYSIDILDLHGEGFDPRFTPMDHAHFWGGPLSEDIALMHRRFEQADRLAFIYPVYWWGMPAMMKGWIERVFTGGWAYQYGIGVQDRGSKPLQSLLGNIPTVLIGIGGAKEETYDKYGYGQAMRIQTDLGIFAYCGITDVQSHLITDVEAVQNAAKRTQGLGQVCDIANEFISERRKVHNVKADYLRERGRL